MEDALGLPDRSGNFIINSPEHARISLQRVLLEYVINELKSRGLDISRDGLLESVALDSFREDFVYWLKEQNGRITTSLSPEKLLAEVMGFGVDGGDKNSFFHKLAGQLGQPSAIKVRGVILRAHAAVRHAVK